MRSVSLHESALSPAEYELWHDWLQYVTEQEALQGKMAIPIMLDLIYSAATGLKRDRDEEVGCIAGQLWHD
jgi:hypothetical protein